MSKYQLLCPYIVNRFEKHSELKDSILKAINDETDVDHLYEEEDPSVNITRCDWNRGRFNPNRPWLEIFRPHLFEHLSKTVTEEMGYAYFKIFEIWFQQYDTGSIHGWHQHTCNWTNVYYLDLPKDSPKTQFINPFDQTTILEFDVEEGDILTFPSFVIHRAPLNQSSYRKTIISWNMDTELHPSLYKN